MKVLLQMPVSSAGRTVAPGNVLDLPERSAKALVAEGRATLLLEQKSEIDANAPSKPQDTPNVQVDTKTPTAGESATEGKPDTVAKALGNQYKRDELAKAAKAVGVEFHYDAVKAEIIDAVIAQGKADVLLK